MDDLDPALIAAIALIARHLLEMAAKAIPDDADGWRGLLRKALKCGALYVSNKERS